MDSSKHNRHDWFADRMVQEDYRLRKCSDEEDELLRRAYSGLHAGELEPLVKLLKSSAGGLHPLISRVLIAMIESDGDYCDFKIETKINAHLKRASQSTLAKLRKCSSENRIALIVAKNNGHKPNMYHAAIAATCDETGLGKSSVAKFWSTYKSRKEYKVKKYAWLTELSQRYGGFNAVAGMEKAGTLSIRIPDNFIVENFEAKVDASIDRDVSNNTEN